jgi:hypothetical protein
VADRRVSTDFLLVFAPDHWSSVNKFRQFAGPPFEVTRDLVKGANSAENHLSKFIVLAGLANRLTGQLVEDVAELAEKGHSSAIRSKEFAALVETLFCELYAALDGVRRTLYAAYKKVRGVQNESTEKLFKRASEKKYGPEFPEDIRAALASAYGSWFPHLRRIRTELTHGEVGSCHVDEQTQRVVYMHSGLGSPTKALVIEDVGVELNRHFTAVSELVETIFQSLFSKLQPVPRPVVCGFYKGRIYQREVAASQDLSFNSGTCSSRSWFESEAGYECPLRQRCGAYQQATVGEGNIAKPVAAPDPARDNGSGS